MNAFKVQNRHRKERGIVTLLTAVVLMLAVFGISYYMSNTIITESRVSASQLRGIEAFNAAASGIEIAKASTDIASIASQSYPMDPVTFTVTVEEVSSGLLKLESTGFSRDNSVSRKITVYKAAKPSDFNPPSVPIVAKGGIKASGNMTGVNNYSNLTVWNGLNTGIQGSASTYTKIDGVKNQLSTIKATSGTATYGADVVTGDQNLANATEDEMVQAFFGYDTLTDFANAMGADASSSQRVSLNDIGDGSDTNTYCYLQNCASGEVRASSYGGIGDFQLGTLGLPKTSTLASADYSSWEAANPGRSLADIDDGFPGSKFGFTTSGTDVNFDTKYIGTPTNPVLIVATGEVTIPSNTFIFGVVVASKITINANSSVFGGMVALSNDDDAFTGLGGPIIFMDQASLDNAGQSAEYGPAKSSWKDW